ncbi:MAG TPA: hypothetical protein VK988_19910 [Acidimicrobiales bacterium]|nr:hypothetical protein [Acidimicrobiales bacterium]
MSPSIETSRSDMSTPSLLRGATRRLAERIPHRRNDVGQDLRRHGFILPDDSGALSKSTSALATSGVAACACRPESRAWLHFEAEDGPSSTV